MSDCVAAPDGHRASRPGHPTGARRLRLAGALLLAGCLFVGAGRATAGPPAPAVPRGAMDVYERGRASIRDILVLVAGDLKLRADAWTKPFAARAPRAVMVLVVDPTTSMVPELQRVREALPEVIAAGPAGMTVGVVGASAESSLPGDLDDAKNTLTLLMTIPLDGRKNLLEAVREGAGALGSSVTEPRAVVLMTREGGDGEDDVEATRSALEARGAAFYSIAPEAAFERSWDYDFEQREVEDLGLTQRMHPMPKRRKRGELFFGADVAFPMVPYRWELEEFPFAQTEFDWPGSRGRFPPPSGFGYWCLATLSWSTGGRCFVHNFRAPGARSRDEDRTITLYDMGFLNLFAPDLRPREKVLASLEGMRRAHVIVRVWEHLADDVAPVVRDHGTLEKPGGGALTPRPMLPIRSNTPFATTYRTRADVQRARETAVDRKARVEQALDWWADEAKRETTGEASRTDPLRQRVEANFDLLGSQLLKVRFHWGEVIGALDAIDKGALDGTKSVVLRPEPLAAGLVVLRPTYRLPDVVRASAFVDAMASVRRIAQKYHGTPWAVAVERGVLFTVGTVVIEPRPEPRPDPRPEPPKKPEKPAKPEPPAKPPPPPPPPERPGSGVGGPTTNK
ncbi:MAG: hypothetical protein JNM10_15330 [Planctomycetia bacterium]|nr:hypothetical protein [Planctomycetia bacterium]